MTNTKRILNVIDSQFRGRAFQCRELSAVVKFQAGRYLAHLCKLQILQSEKQGSVNVYRIGPRWDEREKLIMDVPSLGYIRGRVLDAVKHAGQRFTISEVDSYLRKEFSQATIRNYLQIFSKEKLIEGVAWENRERVYQKLKKNSRR